MRLRRSIRSRRYWTTYGSFAFVLGVTWTVIAAAQKTAELRWVHWILAAVWFGIAVGSFVRASRQAVDPQSAPPPSE
jgi:hypothetical protein